MDEKKISFKGKRCRILGSSQYFLKKYGTCNPEIIIEDTDRAVMGSSWMDMTGNPAALLYAMRSGASLIPLGGTVYYGKIKNLGELVHESELELV